MRNNINNLWNKVRNNIYKKYIGKIMGYGQTAYNGLYPLAAKAAVRYSRNFEGPRARAAIAQAIARM
jgi:hypothetical protein